MYSAATLRLAEVMDLHFLDRLAGAFFWIALAAWAAAGVGLVRRRDFVAR